MRGHEEIIRTRKGGMKPVAVYVEMRDYPSGIPDWSRSEHTVYVETADNIELLDLFFLNRCFVTISGSNTSRVRLLFGAIQDHGAERVLAHVVKPVGDTVDIIEIMDTKGIMTWHANEEVAHG